MRYTRFRQYLARENRDMRNPYGSRGGYVVSDRRGRDYDYRMGDMARDREYNSGNADMHYYEPDFARGGRGNQYSRQSSRDNDYNYDMRGMNYDMARGRDYNYDMRDRNYDMNMGYDMRGRDYAEENYRLTPTEIRKWEKELKKENGSAFTTDQIRQIAQQHGIRFEEFTPELLTVIANMMYSDYGETVKGDISTFVKLAKDFLCDEDFDGTPEEKAYLYYNTIVNKDDD